MVPFRRFHRVRGGGALHVTWFSNRWSGASYPGNTGLDTAFALPDHEGEETGPCSAFVKVQDVNDIISAPPTIEVVFAAAMKIAAKIHNGSIVDTVELIRYAEGLWHWPRVNSATIPPRRN